MSTLTLMDIL